jgi:quercetin dioxygenase-like cupin family protein
LGQTISFKAEPEDTDDALFLFEHRMPPTLGVPAHTERNYEAFYVLEGTLEIEGDGQRYRLGPGEFLSLRPGVVHSLHNPGPGMVRILTLVSPGSQHARFFTTVADRGPEQPADARRAAGLRANGGRRPRMRHRVSAAARAQRSRAGLAGRNRAVLKPGRGIPSRSLFSLFTGVRGIGILGSSLAGSCINRGLDYHYRDAGADREATTITTYGSGE